jgi:hypothetical protein
MMVKGRNMGGGEASGCYSAPPRPRDSPLAPRSHARASPQASDLSAPWGGGGGSGGQYLYDPETQQRRHLVMNSR